jgi:hypothetical protein
VQRFIVGCGKRIGEIVDEWVWEKKMKYEDFRGV